jgi:hypothetical protein
VNGGLAATIDLDLDGDKARLQVSVTRVAGKKCKEGPEGERQRRRTCCLWLGRRPWRNRRPLDARERRLVVAWSSRVSPGIGLMTGRPRGVASGSSHGRSDRVMSEWQHIRSGCLCCSSIDAFCDVRGSRNLELGNELLAARLATVANASEPQRRPCPALSEMAIVF